jgi:hypothetical protein
LLRELCGDGIVVFEKIAEIAIMDLVWLWE